MKLSIDLESGAITGDGADVTEQQLKAAIELLASARAALVTEPTDPTGIPVRTEGLAAWYTEAMGPKGSAALIAFRFTGLGWLGATLSAADRTKLIALLSNQHDVHLSLGGTGPAPTPGGAGGGIH